jgi:hypothetical protein
MAQNNILRTTQSRVFMTLSKSSPAVKPLFQDCMVLGGISQSFGDREPIFCQDPYRIGRYKIIGFTESPAESVESSLNARFPFTARSALIQAARAQAPVDLHVHMGAIGSNPTVFNAWTKKIIFEGARISSVDIDEVGAHDEDTPVGHSVDITADDWYEIVPMSFSERGTSVSTEIAGDVALFYNGRLELQPRERVMAFAVMAGDGSTTSPSLLYSLDQGTNWYAVEMTSVTTSGEANGVAVVGDYVTVVGGTGTAGKLLYTRWSGLNTVTTPTITQVTTGFVTSKIPNDIYSIGSVAFVAADGGYVYKISDTPSGVSVMSAGTASTQNLFAIAAFDENVIVAVGASNTVLVCTDGDNFSAVTGPASGTALTAVACLSETVFLVGTADGKLFFTQDAGVSWTQKSFQGSGASGAVVNDLAFANSMVGYMAYEATGASGILMTTDGGYSWDYVPSAGLLSYSTGYLGIAALRDDPNIVLAAGPNENDTAGSLIMGEPVA